MIVNGHYECANKKTLSLKTEESRFKSKLHRKIPIFNLDIQESFTDIFGR